MAKAKQRNLDDLFYDTLKDIYYAERKILKALPKMARAANDEKLKAAFETHRDQTETHVERLQQCFELLGKRAQGKTCDAIEGILAEGEEIMEEFSDSVALDAGLISAARQSSIMRSPVTAHSSAGQKLSATRISPSFLMQHCRKKVRRTRI